MQRQAKLLVKLASLVLLAYLVVACALQWRARERATSSPGCQQQRAQWRNQCQLALEGLGRPELARYQFSPPSRSIPDELLSAFTQNGAMPVRRYAYVNEVTTLMAINTISIPLISTFQTFKGAGREQPFVCSTTARGLGKRGEGLAGQGAQGPGAQLQQSGAEADHAEAQGPAHRSLASRARQSAAVGGGYRPRIGRAAAHQHRRPC